MCRVSTTCLEYLPCGGLFTFEDMFGYDLALGQRGSEIPSCNKHVRNVLERVWIDVAFVDCAEGRWFVWYECVVVRNGGHRRVCLLLSGCVSGILPENCVCCGVVFVRALLHVGRILRSLPS